MKPFLISDPCFQLTQQYPDYKTLIDVAKVMYPLERESLLRLWFSEGIPWAFRNAPIVYETIRGWLASQIGVHPKVVTIVGSARIGYSLASHPDYGRPFTSDSDLDFVAVSETLFNELSTMFYKWKEDVEAGFVLPRNPAQQKFWEDNLRRLPSNISRGFVDAYKIPYFDRYPIAQNIGDRLSLLEKKLLKTKDAPRVRKTSLRVYRDWNSFITQMMVNLQYTLKSLNP